MTRLIPLTQGQFAKVDDADYERVMEFRWCARKHGKGFLAVRALRKYGDGRHGFCYLHRFVLDALPEISVRHRKRDTLDNTRDNLYSIPRKPTGMSHGKKPSRKNTSGEKHGKPNA